ncbi:protein of unknown function [Cupriavidus taiwanensis]|uniref:SnoaL-like domain-containing protein n=1 Tax=Cupriavidus taiwanensis TaxID=164546 RepID=A0A375IH08_9BURK|nr:protein of unknown function [Cupriavidus taiwanensis]
MSAATQSPQVEHAATLADRYLAAWNETDAARRRELIAAAWTETACYVDPLMRGDGHAGIDAMIAAAQAKFPGFRFTRVSPVDAHGEHLRFTWELGPAGEAALDPLALAASCGIRCGGQGKANGAGSAEGGMGACRHGRGGGRGGLRRGMGGRAQGAASGAGPGRARRHPRGSGGHRPWQVLV